MQYILFPRSDILKTWLICISYINLKKLLRKKKKHQSLSGCLMMPEFFQRAINLPLTADLIYLGAEI